MTSNKKMMTVFLLGAFFVGENTMARITGVRTPSAPSAEGGSTGRGKPSGVKKTEASKEEFQIVTGVNNSSCVGDMDQEKYFPLSLFGEIARDEDAGLDISLKPGNKVSVKIPPVLNVCGDFVPELRQNKETKSVSVLMKLIGTQKEKKGVSLTHKEFEECLIENKIIVDGKIDYDKIPAKNYSESTYTLEYDYDRKKDIKKTVTLTYGYPKAYNDPKNGYKPLWGIDEKGSVPGEACMLAEKVAENPVYINKGKDVLIEEINAICASGDAQKIAEARRSLGNADALKDITDKIKSELEGAYLIAMKSDVAKIDAELKKIEARLNKEKSTIDEEEAKKLTGKYASLAKELDEKFINPAIMRLDSLMQKRKGLEDPSGELKSVDAEIKQLNTDIAQFSKRNPTSFQSLYSVMEKYSISDSAKTIEDIRLKSYLYGKVYGGKEDPKRGKALTFEAANKRQFDQLEKFDRTLNDWNEQYLVAQGNTFPIKKTEKERQGAIDRMNSRWAAFEKKEYDDYISSCSVGLLGSVKNPVRCKSWAEGLEKRRASELKRRDQDLAYIKGRNDKLARLGTNFNEYQKNAANRKAREDESYESYGSSYTNYDDNFEDRFPGYYGPQTSTAYNPALYNLGVGAPGQQQFPQQYFPQQQFQQGPQGWPSF